ncbi:MAG TPA: hypothetical protein DCX70_00240 [Chitinophagaceae bacterium]|nr:hypothetical protein [Chitinophagaceae bacterium]
MIFFIKHWLHQGLYCLNHYICNSKKKLKCGQFLQQQEITIFATLLVLPKCRKYKYNHQKNINQPHI